MVAADVPVPPGVMPAGSVTNVRLTELATVAVTATVPEAVVAKTGLLTRVAKPSTIKPASSLRFIFHLLSSMRTRYVFHAGTEVLMQLHCHGAVNSALQTKDIRLWFAL